MNLPIPILSALIGVVILLFGRKLFWLCVAAVGFAARGGDHATFRLMNRQHCSRCRLRSYAGLDRRTAGNFSCRKSRLRSWDFWAAENLAGAIAAAFFVEHAQYSGIIFVIGGIIGAILLLTLFDWALIVPRRL